MDLFLAYLATCFLIIATPGPSAFLMMQHAAVNGIDKCVYNALGSISASSILIVIALTGASFFIGSVFVNVLTVIGGLFLIWIGITCFREMRFEHNQNNHKTGRALYKDAFITGLTNPKDIIFFVSFLPQFLNTEIPYWLAGFYLLIGWVCLDFLIMFAYAGLSKYYINMTHENNGITHIRTVSGVLMLCVGASISYAAVRPFI